MAKNIFFISEKVVSGPETLEWLLDQIEGDAIEDVNDEMLQKLVSGDLAGSQFCKLPYSHKAKNCVKHLSHALGLL